MFVIVIFAGSFMQAADLKVAVVDMELIMKAYPETKSSRLILEEQLSEFEKEQQGMLDERDENGDYSDWQDFVNRIEPSR